MKLTKKQTKALDYLEDDVTNELVFGGGAGGAKSVLGCYWSAKMCMKYPGVRGVIGRAVLKTLRETTLNSFFWAMSQQGLINGHHYKYNAQTNVISFITGSEILLKDLYSYPSDPNFDELGSLEITFAFVDECNQVTEKAWNILKSRIRYRLDEYGLIPKILGTCNPAKNWVYSNFYKPSRDGNIAANKQFVQSLLSDNPFISKHYKDNLLSLDKNSKERLLHGNWEYDDDPSALMTIDKINDIFTNDFVPEGDKYITADIARFGSDSSTIVFWKGLRAERIVQLKKKKTTDVAEMINGMRKMYGVPMSNVICDEDGVGGGVVDQLGCEGFVNNSTALEGENFANLKSQCYFKLADLVNSNSIFVNTDDPTIKEQLVEELEQVKQKDMDKDGKKAIIPKDKVKELIGRSPDLSDALMMRMYFEIGYEEIVVL
ncbi:hypothetical protein FKG96_09950 [Olivibacter sp. LS-1]|uniref:phage terminase large subunit n=1 Tax=Olivibacter sp. LS-1 TaxID=2592345 RepID=UPI0011EA782E|nr:phage terminase large subunit [Olivibacter sp. LS-1]QEL01116.1 hypothetical protein FKG96_09950 [Olivibacter sp. LS-1]